MGEHKATVTAEVKGADKAAKELGKMTEAEGRLGQKTQEARKAGDQATRQTEKLNAAESDYVSLLAQLSPAPAMFVDGMLKAGKVSGDLATEQINLNALFPKGIELVKKYSGALTLIGTGGAVVLAIMAIVAAIKDARRNFEDATRAVHEHIAALSALKG